MNKREKVVRLLIAQGRYAKQKSTLEENAQMLYDEVVAMLPKEKCDEVERFEVFLERYLSVLEKYLQIECELRAKNFTHKQLDALIAYHETGAEYEERTLKSQLFQIELAIQNEAFAPYLEFLRNMSHECGGCGNGSCGNGGCGNHSDT